MTGPDVAELRRLLEAATPGPWEAEEYDHPGDEGVAYSVYLPGTTRESCKADSALVTAAVNAMPGLLDRLERLARQDAALAAVRELAVQWEQLDLGIGRYPEDSAFRDGRWVQAEACADALTAALALADTAHGEEPTT